MAKEKKQKKDKEEKKKDKKEKKGKKEKKEKEEKPKKAKKEKKGKKDKKEKKAKPEKEKKKKGKKGEVEEPETQEVPEGKGKKGKKGKKKDDKKGDRKEPKKARSSAASAPAGEVPEGVEAVEEPPRPRFNLSWAALHILGMVLMLCDNLWPTVFPASDWLTCLGRMAYPIFAFLLVEGFFHTQNLWLYLLRLLGLAIISEIPFNLMVGGSIVYPLHQNVIWTYIIALLLLILLDEFGERFGRGPMLMFSIIPAFLGYFLGQVMLTDQYGAGVLIVLVFYLFHGKHWTCLLGQLICLWFINLKLLGGFYYIVPFMGYDFDLLQQGLAVLSLLFIWLYYGRQGLHGRVFRWFCYAFYPVHMLVLFIIRVKLGS